MSTYEISKSSLLSLKAEILKKQEELQKAKFENKVKQQKHRGPLELKNKGVESRAENDGFNVDEDLLKQSRSALEAKAKLYEKLSQGSKNEFEKEHNRRYLVHFDKKASKSRCFRVPDLPPEQQECEDEDKYPANDPEVVHNENDYNADNSDDEWVEYVDCFGRTRTCLKKDLGTFQKKDNASPTLEETEPSDVEQEQEKDEQAELLSGDMRRELLRRQWEQEEDQLRDKSNVHYQDILFNEARSHGVGYYGFSKDECVRATQQEALNKLRKETQDQQRQAQQIRKSRERQMAKRIRAARNRKRAREGLGPITTDDEEEEERVKSQDVEPEVLPMKVQPKVDAAKELKRKQHVRPWDVGKEGVLAAKDIEKARIASGIRDPYSQDEWNSMQRTKRTEEFAPPQSYSANLTTKRHVNPYKPTERISIRNECNDNSSSEDELLKDFAKAQTGATIPPPASYDYYGPTSSKRANTSRNDANMEDSIMQGLKYLREQIEQNKH